MLKQRYGNFRQWTRRELTFYYMKYLKSSICTFTWVQKMKTTFFLGHVFIERKDIIGPHLKSRWPEFRFLELLKWYNIPGYNKNKELLGSETMINLTWQSCEPAGAYQMTSSLFLRWSRDEADIRATDIWIISAGSFNLTKKKGMIYQVLKMLSYWWVVLVFNTYTACIYVTQLKLEHLTSLSISLNAIKEEGKLGIYFFLYISESLPEWYLFDFQIFWMLPSIKVKWLDVSSLLFPSRDLKFEQRHKALAAMVGPATGKGLQTCWY